MSRTEDILSRIPGVESRPRWIDRDARRAVLAVILVGSAVGLAAVLASPPDASMVVDAPVRPMEADVSGAFERLRTPGGIESESSSGEATGEGERGYEIKDAIGPGRRS